MKNNPLNAQETEFLRESTEWLETMVVRGRISEFEGRSFFLMTCALSALEYVKEQTGEKPQLTAQIRKHLKEFRRLIEARAQSLDDERN